MTTRITATPVRTGTFHDGPDTLLLNPQTPRRRWHRERLRALLLPQTLLIGLAGAVAPEVIQVPPGWSGVIANLSVITAVGAGIVLAVGIGRLLRMPTDHRHPLARPCRLDRVRGEFFFRSRDFTDLGPDNHLLVRNLIAGVDELHRSPARAWLDPQLCAEVHQLVWQTLACLDRTRAARNVAAELTAESDTDTGALAAAAREAVAVIDHALDQVAHHLHGCLVLTRAWEAKARSTELTTRTGRALAELPGSHLLHQLAEAAEGLPQSVFAYITAARDVTGAGTFPWERPRSTWPHTGGVTSRRATWNRTGRAGDDGGSP
ncbi:hypothetical protein AB0383_16605 [Amycolatopsis sp. NPDC051373]|uniref:hypothetical protein n=1 Tax=Amycolatopsis sp. NPDC051373 TaxID=3155801 RepID=UPI00344D984F